MSLLIKVGEDFVPFPIRGPSSKSLDEILDSDFIPQQVRDYPLGAKIDISEKPNSYVVRSELPGVELKNLWVSLERRNLTVYAGITGEKRKNGTYRYTKELLGGIRGEAMLPEQVVRKPAKAKFDNGVLTLAFPKITEELLDRVAFETY